jgi:hypothetical protein
VQHGSIGKKHCPKVKFVSAYDAKQALDVYGSVSGMVICKIVSRAREKMPEVEWSPQATKCLFSGSGCELLHSSGLHEGREGGGPEEGACRAGLLTVIDLIFGPPGTADCDGLGR